MTGLNAITIIVTFMCLLNTMAASVKAFNCTPPTIYNRTASIECSSEAADKMKDCKFYINTHNLTVIENATEINTTLLDGLFQNNCSLQIPLLNLGPGQHQISARMTFDTAGGEMVDISPAVEIDLKSTLENVVCDIIFYYTLYGHIVVCSADMVYLDINCEFNITMRGAKYHNPGSVSYSSDIYIEDNTQVYKDRCTLYFLWQSYSVNMEIMNGSDIIEIKNSSFSTNEIAFDPVCESEMSKSIYPGDTRTCKCNFSVLGKGLDEFSLEELITNLIDYVPGNPDTALSISLEDIKNHKTLFCGPVTRTGRSKIFVAYYPALREPPKITYFHAFNQNNDMAGDGGNTDLVVDLYSNVLFTCSATGIPPPDLELIQNDYYGKKRTLKSSDQISYVKKMTDCREAGQYSCETNTDFFKTTATKSINVYIRCPQELYDTQTKTWYGLIMGTQGRVSVPLFGYPAPTKLKLEKQHDANMTDFSVVYKDTSMLTGNVTVIFTVVEEKHMGVYKLTVGNGIGTDFSYDFRVFKDSTNKLMSSYGVLYLAMFLWALVWKLA